MSESSSIDYWYWINLPTWSLAESAVLLAGSDPNETGPIGSFAKGWTSCPQIEPVNSIHKKLWRTYGVYRRYHIVPHEVLGWAYNLKQAVPPGLNVAYTGWYTKVYKKNSLDQPSKQDSGSTDLTAKKAKKETGISPQVAPKKTPRKTPWYLERRSRVSAAIFNKARESGDSFKRKVSKDGKVIVSKLAQQLYDESISLGLEEQYEPKTLRKMIRELKEEGVLASIFPN